MAFECFILLFVIFAHSDEIKAQGHTKIWTIRDEAYIDVGSDKSDCINQTFVYQKQGGIYFDIPEEINTIILPMNGAVIFQQNQEIKFKAKQPKCHGDDYYTRHFKMHILRDMSWFDTDNWRIKGSLSQNKAVPHIDRIPCECDVVEFPANHSLWIDLNFIPQLTVQQVIINGKSDNLNGFLDTNLGQSMFMYYRDYVRFQEGLCEGPKSCGCHDPALFKEYLDLVCIHSEVCQEPPCLDPIQPIGHCCPICGAMIQVTVGEDNCLSDFKSANENMELFTLMKEKYAGKVDGYIGMVRGDHDKEIKFQIIAVDKEDYNELSVQMVKGMSESKKFNAMLKADGNTHRVFYSGRPYHVNGLLSIWFIVFTSLLLVLSMFGTIYFYYGDDTNLKKYNPISRLRLFTSPFVFARFDNTRDDDTQSIAIEFEAPQPSTSIYETIASAFDNPLFKGRNKEKKIETIGPN
ncbi:Protein amnionless, partial [Pseudolycoriella hygida]